MRKETLLYIVVKNLRKKNKFIKNNLRFKKDKKKDLLIRGPFNVVKFVRT